MAVYETRAEVFDKVDWEGGIDSVQRYGLSVADLPEHDPELLAAWAAMAAAWKKYEPLSRKVMNLLEAP